MDSHTIAIGGTAALTVPKLGEFPLVESYVCYAYPGYGVDGRGRLERDVPVPASEHA